MHTRYYIGFDIGSSSVKVALVDAESGKNLLSLHEPPHEMSIISEQNDWAEQNPNDWWDYICTATKRVIRESKIDASKIDAVGISYQMHGLVVLDKSGTPLRNSIICISLFRISDTSRTKHNINVNDGKAMVFNKINL